MTNFAREHDIARDCVGELPRRWAHLTAVGATAERLAGSHDMPEAVVRAAWLHDVGYGEQVKATGFHPIDGARYLESIGIESLVVQLVAHHTGAKFEADERGLQTELAEFPEPDQDLLDLLTMVDLATSPDGAPVREVDRIDEILSRYEPGDPVHRSVTRARPDLLASSLRGKKRLGLPDDWPVRS